MHGVVHSYRHGRDAEGRSCEPFLTHTVKGRLSTEAHSAALRTVNLCGFRISCCYRLNASLYLPDCGRKFSS